jgi:hypothetical protein
VSTPQPARCQTPARFLDRRQPLRERPSRLEV